MLLLLIITLTNAPNNSSVCVVSLHTHKLLPEHGKVCLNFPRAKLRPSGAQGRFKQALENVHVIVWEIRHEMGR